MLEQARFYVLRQGAVYTWVEAERIDDDYIYTKGQGVFNRRTGTRLNKAERAYDEQLLNETPELRAQANHHKDINYLTKYDWFGLGPNEAREVVQLLFDIVERRNMRNLQRKQVDYQRNRNEQRMRPAAKRGLEWEEALQKVRGRS